LEIVLREMVQEQVGNGYVVGFWIRPPQPIEYIHLQSLDLPGERLELRLSPGTQQPLAVHQHNAQRLPARSHAFREPQQKGSIACAQLDEGPGRSFTKGASQRANHDLGVSHPRIYSLQIPARPDRTTIAGRQFIKQFAFHFAYHQVDFCITPSQAQRLEPGVALRRFTTAILLHLQLLFPSRLENLHPAGVLLCAVRFHCRRPTDLVITGLYRYVLNPMYMAVLSAILSQGLILGECRALLARPNGVAHRLGRL